MLRSTTDLLDLAIAATDNATDRAIGEVKDLYFDDESWAIRYLVVETGSWLASRKVLISPIAAGKPEWAAKLLPVALTRTQIKHSPDIDTDMPITRQHEVDHLDYYNYAYYWGGMGLWGGDAYPYTLMPGYDGYGSTAASRSEADAVQARAAARNEKNDPHLRSCKAVTGYHIAATDGELGHVKAMLVDEESWAVRYLVVSTSNWWLGHDVLVATPWLRGVDWAEQTVSVDLTRDALKLAPTYDPAVPLTREMQDALARHHGRGLLP